MIVNSDVVMLIIVMLMIVNSDGKNNATKAGFFGPLFGK